MKHKWPLAPLGELLTERRETPGEEDLATGRVRVIEKINFGSGSIQLRESGFTRTAMIIVRPGDLVISGINAAKGAIAIYDFKATEPVAATIHYSSYIPNPNRVDVRFLWWMLRCRLFQDLLNEYVPGGIKTELKASRLLPVPVPLAPLPDQRRIVARLEEFSSVISEAKECRSDIAGMTKGFLEAGIEAIMSPAEARGRIGDIIALKPRSGPSFVTHRDWTGTPVLMPSAVSGFGVDISKVEFGIGPERVSPLDMLEPKDILIARGNKREQVGNAGVVPEATKGWVAANLLMRMTVKPNQADPYFLVWWLRSPTMRTIVSKSMSGTNPNIQKINQRKVLAFPFPTHLRVDEQRRIVDELDALQAEIDQLKKLQAETDAELDALLPSILDGAFKGDL